MTNSHRNCASAGAPGTASRVRAGVEALDDSCNVRLGFSVAWFRARSIRDGQSRHDPDGEAVAANAAFGSIMTKVVPVRRRYLFTVIWEESCAFLFRLPAGWPRPSCS